MIRQEEKKKEEEKQKKLERQFTSTNTQAETQSIKNIETQEQKTEKTMDKNKSVE